MKKEKYNGWIICTERQGWLADLVTRKFEFGKYGWLIANIHRARGTDEYYVSMSSSEPFKMHSLTLHTRTSEKDYHALIDEANDVLRAAFTEMHEYIIAMINELPEI